jgi:hypothetical protein
VLLQAWDAGHERERYKSCDTYRYLSRCKADHALGCAGWSFFRHNLTEERVEDLPPGKGAAAAMLLTANASRAANATWTRRVRDAWARQTGPTGMHRQTHK